MEKKSINKNKQNKNQQTIRITRNFQAKKELNDILYSLVSHKLKESTT